LVSGWVAFRIVAIRATLISWKVARGGKHG
jgi:hypothetical protein